MINLLFSMLDDKICAIYLSKYIRKNLGTEEMRVSLDLMIWQCTSYINFKNFLPS